MPSLSVLDIASKVTAPEPVKPVLLVVDDEEGPRTSLRVVFKNEFDVLLASNGTDALKLARTTKVDVAILDILMHGMSGVDVLRELKQIDEDIEVIMLTAYETLETARQALRLGAREYLNKPFDIAALRTAARRALAKRRTSLELKGAHSRLEAVRAEIAVHGDIAALRTAARRALAKRRTSLELKGAHSRLEALRAEIAAHGKIAEPAGDTAGNILHDLNSPLTVINGFIELIHKQVSNAASLEGEELEKMKGSIARVHSQVVRCLEISKRYLGVRHAGESVPSDRVAVNEVLLDLEELLSRHPCAAGCELTLSELDGHTHAAISGTHLLRVLINLALNGLQSAGAPVRVNIIAQMLPERFDFTGFKNDANERFIAAGKFVPGAPMIAISVRDSGPGISPDVVARLFAEPFTTKPPGKGTGLGLGSVKALVLEARGAVRLTTKIGAGSTFTVFLPLAS